MLACAILFFTLARMMLGLINVESVGHGAPAEVENNNGH